MHAIVHALAITGSMTWEITWALILGFGLSAVVQAVVRKATIVRLLGDDWPRTLALAAGFGAASSSCSYAAVALARSLFRKGASFTAAMAFEIASTNLVIELGVILALLMGWQFTLAEFTGGPVMIVLIAVLFRLLLRDRLLREARVQADRGIAGSMEGHAAMDMSVQRPGSFASRLFSRDGFTSVAHVFVMEWAAIIRDLVIGLFIAGAIAAWVPDRFWQSFFITGHPLAAKLWGPLIGPVVAIVSFVCSIGNVPLAVVLWKGGISFGGVVAFIFADLIMEVLRTQDGPVPARHVLRDDGRGGVRRRACLRRFRPDPEPDHGEDPRPGRVLGLHHLAEYRLPGPRGCPDHAVRSHRRDGHAADDGRLARPGSASSLTAGTSGGVRFHVALGWLAQGNALADGLLSPVRPDRGGQRYLAATLASLST